MEEILSLYKKIIREKKYFDNFYTYNFGKVNYLKVKSIIYDYFEKYINCNDLENFKFLTSSLFRDNMLESFTQILFVENLKLLEYENDCIKHLYLIDIKFYVRDNLFPFKHNDHKIFNKLLPKLSNNQIYLVFDQKIFYLKISNEILFLVCYYHKLIWRLSLSSVILTEDRLLILEHAREVVEMLKEVCSKHDFSYEL